MLQTNKEMGREVECNECKKALSEQDALMCQRCNNYVCIDCQPIYNKFTQIDYDCCLTCANTKDND